MLLATLYVALIILIVFVFLPIACDWRAYLSSDSPALSLSRFPSHSPRATF